VQTLRDVACTVCGCLCDDLELQTTEGRISAAQRACKLAEPWIFAINDARPPVAALHGRAVALEAAIEEASRILRAGRNPLIFGLSRSSTQGQRAAVRLGEVLGANVDTTASVCHGPSIMAIQQVGESTSSLGEVRNRADLVIFWGANPAESHPRHFERYSLEPAGLLVPRGRKDRTLVVVDTKPTETSQLADLFLQVKPGADFDVIWSLRQLVRGDTPFVESDAGVPLSALRDLAQRMTACRYGVVFFGLGLAQRGLGHLTVEALLRLVAELNDHTRFTARRMRIPGDVTGADSVLCWQTGYPFAVNLARDFPRYNPGEFTADDLLARRETDACLLIGSESVAMLSPAARKELERIPTIAVDYPHIGMPWEPAVRFTTAVYGIHRAGTAYRMDEIPIPLCKVIDCDYPSDEEVLSAILRSLEAPAPS
jgi:formylmethanofuran dehydrogenase subunit B